MKITKPKKSNVTFGNLNEGDVFHLINDSANLLMKMEKCGSDGEVENCVYLDDGTTSWVSANTEVIPVDCELIIK